MGKKDRERRKEENSTFLTTTAHALMKMDFPFPEATAQQLMYGTYSMPSKYFDLN
jgi:hypothetical protein